jgi:ribonuclease P protein component
VGDLWRIRSSATFASLGRTRHRARQGPVWVRWVPPPPGSASSPEVAFAIGRKVGGAVVRNRLRRRLRAILRSLDLAPGAYLVGVSVADPAASALSFAQLSGLVRQAVADVVAVR